MACCGRWQGRLGPLVDTIHKRLLLSNSCIKPELGEVGPVPETKCIRYRQHMYVHDGESRANAVRFLYFCASSVNCRIAMSSNSFCAVALVSLYAHTPLYQFSWTL